MNKCELNGGDSGAETPSIPGRETKILYALTKVLLALNT